jgi:hypothetical protein
VHCQADLVHVVAARHASGGLANLLDSRQQQSDEDAYDSNDDQELDQRKR